MFVSKGADVGRMQNQAAGGIIFLCFSSFCRPHGRGRR